MIFRLNLVLLCLTSLSAACFAAATDVNPDFSRLEEAVLDGRDIHLTLDLSQCLDHGSGKAGPEVRGSLRVDAFMIRSDQTIAFSTTHFTVRPDKTPVDEFLSFRARPTGKIEVHTMFLNAATYAIFQESEFDCGIGKGASFHW